MTFDCDVAIVGAGPVGAAAAAGLVQRGLRVQLLDRGGPTPPVLSDNDDYDLRVYALAPSCTAFLDRLGVWTDIVAARSSPYQAMRIWEHEPQTALRFDAGDVHAAQLGTIVESSLLAKVLWQSLPAGVARGGAQVQTLEVEDDGAQLNLAGGDVVRARLVVIAEGRDSRLRAQLGIEAVSGQYEQHAVVCHVATTLPHRRTAWQRFLPTGPLAFLPLADGRSSIVWSSSEAQTLLSLDDEDFCRALGDASQHALGEIRSCTRRVSFSLGMQHADTYVASRAVLVGDAAHIVHPLAGQGVNLGIADVEALVDAIGAAHQQGRDPGAPRVLARYQRARRADIGEMIAVTDGIYRAYRLPLGGIEHLRGRLLGLVDAATPLKRQLIRRAIGLR